MGKTPAVKLSETSASSQGQISMKQPPPPPQSLQIPPGQDVYENSDPTLTEAPPSSSASKMAKTRRPTSKNHPIY